MKKLIPLFLIFVLQAVIYSCKRSPEGQLVYMTEALNNDDCSKDLGDLFGTVLKYSYVPDSATVVIDYQVAGRKIFMNNEHYSVQQATWFIIPWLYQTVNCVYFDLIAETNSNLKIFFYDSESDCKRSSALYSVLLTPEDIEKIKGVDYSAYDEAKESLFGLIASSDESAGNDDNHVYVIGDTFEGIYCVTQFHYPQSSKRSISDWTEQEAWDVLYGNESSENFFELLRIYDGMNIGAASELIQGDNHMIVLLTPDQIKDLLMKHDAQQ